MSHSQLPDAPASDSAPSSPPQPLGRLLRALAKADASGQRLSPTIAGHILLSAAIILAAVGLYAISFGVILALSNSWKVCPQGQAGIQPTSDAAMQADSLAPAKEPPLSPRMPAAGPGPLVSTLTTPNPQAQQPDLGQVYGNIDRLGPDISASQKFRLKTQLIQFQQAQQISCQIGVFFFEIGRAHV